jgi:putative copper resistance protein D
VGWWPQCPVGWIAALCVAGCPAGLWLLAGATVAQDLVNPVPRTQESMARGLELYGQHCAICHGVQGRGDGPLARTMVPRPSDFRFHMTEGHTEAQLFEWITNGVPDTAMQGFANQLSEEERWHLVNYLQIFAAAAQ